MVYIDVRTADEYNEKHLEGAMHFDMLQMTTGKFPKLDKDTPIVLYCRSGGRAEIAKNLMLSSGFTDVTNGGGLSDLM